MTENLRHYGDWAQVPTGLLVVGWVRGETPADVNDWSPFRFHVYRRPEKFEVVFFVRRGVCIHEVERSRLAEVAAEAVKNGWTLAHALDGGEIYMSPQSMGVIMNAIERCDASDVTGKPSSIGLVDRAP
jgi:hypothetical protein